jgi:hypothetical protein
MLCLGARWGLAISFTEEQNLCTHCGGSWVGPRADLDGYGENLFHPPEVETRAVQLVASRCIDRAIDS